MKNNQRIKQSKRLRRIKRIRAKIFGTKTRPRLTIHRTLKHIYAQAVNDEKSETLVAVSDFELPARQKNKKKTEVAKEIGKLMPQKLKDKKINKVIFDRRGYKYHGIVKAFVDAVREGGIQF
jgi:large subunit ribosomal protein L18